MLAINTNSNYFIENQPSVAKELLESLKKLFNDFIGEKIATLHELRTVYDIEDYLNFLEIIQVNRLNEMVAFQDSKNKGKR